MACDVLRGRGPQRTPFRRGVIVDWYDGPVSGVAECTSTGSVYAFRMITWDSQQQRRIFVLRPLPATALADLEQLFARPIDDQVAWWVPVRFDSESERNVAWHGAMAILDKAGPVEYLVVANDITVGIEDARTVTDDERQQLEERLKNSQSAVDGYSLSDEPFEVWLAVLANGT